MSYSSKIKDEILNLQLHTEDEIYAELFGILSSKHSFNNIGLELKSENKNIIDRTFNHIKKVSNLKIDIKYTISKRFSKSKIYTLTIINTLSQEEEYGKFLQKIFSYKNFSDKNFYIVSSILRGYFLNVGYIKDPHKGYALDFFIDSEDAATFLFLILKYINKRVFQTEKQNKNIIYIRNSEDILDVINAIGGIKTFFEYQEIVITKELNNKINRNMNYEIANETKKVTTALKQIEMIEYIDNKLGLDNLSKALFEVATLRLKNDSDSFQELALKLNISKSGIRNRFRRIEEIYLELKERL